MSEIVHAGSVSGSRGYSKDPIEDYRISIESARAFWSDYPKLAGINSSRSAPIWLKINFSRRNYCHSTEDHKVNYADKAAVRYLAM